MIAIATLAACRIGAYDGSLRGRGTTPHGDASIAMSTYELTSDLLVDRLVVMSSVGGGSLRARTRTMDGKLDESADALDIYVGGGVGYQVVVTPTVHVSLYGMYSHSFLAVDDEASIPSRFYAGVELGARYERLGIVARAAIVHASGTFTNIDLIDPNTFEQVGYDMSANAVLLQIGMFLYLERD